MPARDSGRTLRSVAAELAQLTDDDVEAILSELDAAARRRLTALLGEYHRGGPPAAAPATPGRDLQLTSWLAERVSGAGGTMTAHAARALARVAAEQGWAPPIADGAPARTTQGLLARIGLR